MSLIECPRRNHRHHEGSSSHHYCLLIMQVQALSTEEPKGTKEPLPDLHFGKLNAQVAWHAIREAIMERDGQVCTMCGAKGHCFDELEVHHIIPRVDGGSDHPLNLTTLCKRCHHGRVHGGAQVYAVLPGGQASLGDYA